MSASHWGQGRRSTSTPCIRPRGCRSVTLVKSSLLPTKPDDDLAAIAFLDGEAPAPNRREPHLGDRPERAEVARASEVADSACGDRDPSSSRIEKPYFTRLRERARMRNATEAAVAPVAYPTSSSARSTGRVRSTRRRSRHDLPRRPRRELPARHIFRPLEARWNFRSGTHAR